QLANLREMKRAWTREVCIPAELVEASSRAESRCEQAWRGLRPKSDWATFAPLLREVVSRKREVAAALSAKLGLGVYDALLDGFEPGGRAADITPVFEHLRRALPPLIQQIADVQARAPVVTPAGPFPIERQ